MIENVAQTRKLAETTLDSSKSGSKILPDEERPTNTASGSNEEEDDNVGYVALHAWFVGGCLLAEEEERLVAIRMLVRGHKQSSTPVTHWSNELFVRSSLARFLLP